MLIIEFRGKDKFLKNVRWGERDIIYINLFVSHYWFEHLCLNTSGIARFHHLIVVLISPFMKPWRVELIVINVWENVFPTIGGVRGEALSRRSGSLLACEYSCSTLPIALIYLNQWTWLSLEHIGRWASVILGIRYSRGEFIKNLPIRRTTSTEGGIRWRDWSVIRSTSIAQLGEVLFPSMVIYPPLKSSFQSGLPSVIIRKRFFSCHHTVEPSTGVVAILLCC